MPQKAVLPTALAVLDDMGTDLHEADHDELYLLQKSGVDLRVIQGLVSLQLDKGRGRLAEDLINGIVVALDSLRNIENKAECRT